MRFGDRRLRLKLGHGEFSANTQRARTEGRARRGYLETRVLILSGAVLRSKRASVSRAWQRGALPSGCPIAVLGETTLPVGTAGSAHQVQSVPPSLLGACALGRRLWTPEGQVTRAEGCR